MNNYLVRIALVLFVSTLLVPATRAEDVVVQGKPLQHWIDMLKESDVLAREEGLEVLLQAGAVARPALPEVRALLAKEQPFTVRFRAAMAAWKLGGEAKPAIPVLIDGLGEPNRDFRVRAIQSLGQMGPAAEPAADELVKRLADKDLPLRTEARTALEQIGTGAVPALSKGTEAGSPVRRECVDILGRMGPRAANAVPAVTAVLKDKEVSLRTAAAITLWRIDRTNTANVPVLIEGMKGADPSARRQAADILFAMRPRPKEAAGAFAEVLKGTDPVLRVRAAAVLWEINGKPEELLPALTEGIKSPEFAIRGPALETLRVMGPKAKGALPDLVNLFGTPGIGTVLFVDTFVAIGPEGLAAALKGLEEKPETAAKLNAAQVVANFGPEAVEPLRKLLAHENVNVRLYAVFALGYLGPAAADKSSPALADALKDKDARVQMYAVNAFRQLGPTSEAPAALLEVLKGKDANMRNAALTCLERLRLDPKSALPVLEEVAEKDEVPLYRVRAAELCWKIDPKKHPAAEVAKKALKEKQTLRAADFMARIGGEGREAIPALIEGLKDPQAVIRQRVCDALAEFGSDAKAARPVLLELLKDPQPTTRIAAALALLQLGETEAAVPVVAATLQDLNVQTMYGARIHASLRKLGPKAKAAVPVLRQTVAQPSLSVYRVHVAVTLAAVDPKEKPAALAALTDVMTRSSALTQLEAAAALLELDRDNRLALTTLEKGLGEVSYLTRQAAALALARLGPDAKAALPAVRRALQDESAHVRYAATAAWWKIDNKNPDALTFLKAGVTDRTVRTDTTLQAIAALGELGPDAKAVAPVLVEALRHRSSNVRAAAEAALKKVDPEAARKAGY